MVTDRTARHPLVIAAIVLMAVGLVLTVRGLVRVPAQVRKIQAKAERLQRLHALAAEQEAPDALLDALEQDGTTTAAALEPILRAVLPGETLAIEEGDPKPLRDDWSVRTAQLTLADVSLAQAADAVARMENSRPPWRVTEYTVIPGPVSGRGRVTLTAETLSK